MIKATEQESIELLYRGESLKDLPIEDVKLFNKFSKELDLNKLTSDTNYSKGFNIPQHYKDLDVEEYVYNLIPDGGIDIESCKARVEMELELYRARNLYPVLQLIIYIVDTLRKHNLVWGVGRGSSVASYVLYLLGVHRVDSHKYTLNIREFLK
jgi:DNA polymerase III alpha subunit